jgi:hypothetical protein
LNRAFFSLLVLVGVAGSVDFAPLNRPPETWAALFSYSIFDPLSSSYRRSMTKKFNTRRTFAKN